MSWNVYFRVVRDRPLEPAELDTLARHSRNIHRSLHDFDLVLATADDGDTTVAHGHAERYYDPDDAELRKLLNAISQLRGMVEGATVEVWDDFELIGWSGDTQKFDFMGQSDVRRFPLPALSESRRRVSDLPDDHEFGPDAWTARPVLVPAPDRGEGAPTLHMPEPPSFRVLADGWRRQLSVQGWLHNPHGVLAHVQGLTVVLRDDNAMAVDVLDLPLHQPAAELQFVHGKLDVSPGSLGVARQADVTVDYRIEVRQPVARVALDPGVVPPLDEHYRLPLRGVSVPVAGGPLPLTVQVNAWHGHRHRGFIQVLVELQPEFVPGDLSAQVRALCRDDTGLAMGAGEVHVEFPTDGSAVVGSISIDLPRSRIAHVRSIDLDLEATRTVRVRLGRYALGSGT